VKRRNEERTFDGCHDIKEGRKKDRRDVKSNEKLKGAKTK